MKRVRQMGLVKSPVGVVVLVVPHLTGRRERRQHNNKNRKEGTSSDAWGICGAPNVTDSGNAE